MRVEECQVSRHVPALIHGPWRLPSAIRFWGPFFSSVYIYALSQNQGSHTESTAAALTAWFITSECTTPLHFDRQACQFLSETSMQHVGGDPLPSRPPKTAIPKFRIPPFNEGVRQDWQTGGQQVGISIIFFKPREFPWGYMTAII